MRPTHSGGGRKVENHEGWAEGLSDGKGYKAGVHRLRAASVAGWLGLTAVLGCATAPSTATEPALLATEPAPSELPTIPWTADMSKPMLLESATTAPQLTREYREQAAPGTRATNSVRCTVTVEGLVRACVVEQSVPLMDREVLRWLGQARYRPAMQNGKPVQVSYLFVYGYRVDWAH